MGKDLALVKWIGGQDDGKYTAGVPLEWIRDFNLKKFHNDEYINTSFLTEWRDGKKMPAGGWPLFDIAVIEVSDNLKKLERKIEVLSLEKSPRQPKLKTEAVRSSPRKSSKTSLFQNSTANKVTRSVGAASSQDTKKPASPSKKRKVETTSSVAEKRQKQDSSPPNRENRAEAEKRNLLYDGLNERTLSGIGVLPGDDKDDQHCNGCNFLTTIKSNLDGIGRKLNTISQDVLLIKQQLATKATAKQAKQEPLVAMMQPKTEPELDTVSTVTVKDIFEGGQLRKLVTSGGTSCTFPKETWKTAMKVITPTSMTYALVTGGFDLSVLLKSTYKGGCTKVGPKKGNSSQPLDSRIIGVIKDAVKQRFPHFEDAQFGTAVNNKLSMLKRVHSQNLKKSKVDEEKKVQSRRIIDSDDDGSGDENKTDKDTVTSDHEDTIDPSSDSNHSQQRSKILILSDEESDDENKDDDIRKEYDLNSDQSEKE